MPRWPTWFLTLACAACSSAPRSEAPPWWSQAQPCPSGATLDGTPHPRASEPAWPTDVPDPAGRHHVRCLRTTDGGETVPIGPETRWHANGAVAEEAYHTLSGLVRLERFDAWGRKTLQVSVEAGTQRLWWWYAPATPEAPDRLALEGAARNGHPHGTWRELDTEGREVGRATWTDGTLDTLHARGTGLVLHPEVRWGAPERPEPIPELTDAGRRDLPTCTEGRWAEAANTLIVGPRPITVNGRARLAETRGARSCTALADALRVLREGVWDGRYQADLAQGSAVAMHRDTRASQLAAVVECARNEGEPFLRIRCNTGLQRPPATGPERLQGAPITGEVTAALLRLDRVDQRPEMGRPPEEIWMLPAGTPEVRIATRTLELIVGEETHSIPCEKRCVSLPEAAATALDEALQSADLPNGAVAVSATGGTLQTLLDVLQVVQRHRPAAIGPMFAPDPALEQLKGRTIGPRKTED